MVHLQLLLLLAPHLGRAVALLPQLPLRATRLRTVSRMGVSAPASTLQPLFSFSGEGAEDAISKWERIDDVIMGGVSNSRLVAAPDGECAFFEGRLRELGGGFCGQRMRLLSDPLDLSTQDGVYLDCEADADAPRRAFKVALRTQQDRGEVVYQAQFTPPPLQRSTIFLPFNEFKLVRGPRLVPGVPPLSAAQTNATFQLSIIVTKFLISSDGAALPNFKEGRFRLKLFSVGTFTAVAAPGAQISVPSPMTAEEQSAARPLILKLLSPLLSLLFGEPRRRRRAANKLLEARGMGRLRRIRFAWSLRRSGGRTSVARAAVRTVAVTLQEAVAVAISAPAGALAFIIFRVIRLMRKLKGGKPKMPPLRSA
mmetsp:Transcript_27556/g.41628  ORF Transcript_27556/g.41628 Transcript_27556/m.41628 type:complete len:368 (+) Transcript_27556:40-1143(+)